MPPYPDSPLYNPYRSMPDWLPWIFSQMSNRKMLDFKLCVHGLLCLCLVQWTMKQLFNLFSVPRHLATTIIIASDACDSYPLQTNHLTILRIMGSPDSRLVHDASLCFLCGWIQKTVAVQTNVSVPMFLVWYWAMCQVCHERPTQAMTMTMPSTTGVPDCRHTVHCAH